MSRPAGAAAPAGTRPRWRRRLPWILAAHVAAWWLCGLLGAWLVTRPHPSVVPPRAELAGFAVAEVATEATDGVALRGWLVEAGDAQRCVVLAAGIRGNRLAMLTRAEWYLTRGWSTLLVDLRGTGASDAARITMGYRERLDLAAWFRLLQQRGFAAIGAHGQSLGAAAVVYTATLPTPPAWVFVVLEACYLDIDAAFAARVPLPAWLLWLTWPMDVCAEWFTGVDASDLSPVRAIAALAAPTLIVCGSEDSKVGPDAAQRLFAASPASDKRLVPIAGAGHVDLWSFGPELRQALEPFVAARRAR